MIKMVAFDLDGTVCDSIPLCIENVFPVIDTFRQDPENVVDKLSRCPDALDLFPALYPPDRVVILEYIIVC